MFVEMNGNDEEPKITKVEDLDFNDEDFWDKEYWIKLLKNEKDLDFTKDNWIEKYREIFDKIKKGKALDLGC
ncbi:MAG: hypothetical protein LBF15_00875 [Candidatus Peribacteria bacterium]|jgi:hypothetical protein|nr:hypothetical protein [Candidatus Peribacteria bacterium]